MNEDLQRIQDAVDALGEHFDSVQIMATRYDGGDDGGTVNVSLGAGNFYTRYGQCREWLVKQDERARDSVRDEQ